MDEVGAKTLEEFKTVPVEDIFTAWQKLRKKIKGGLTFPTIDGKMILGKEHKMLRLGEQADVPYMIGSTSHDMFPPLLFSMSRKWCKVQRSDSYLWFFERNLPGDDHGAWHSADLWYWFGTLDKCWRPFEDRDYVLSEEMTDYLTAFAKNGNPNGNGRVTWEMDSSLTLGDNPTVMKKPKLLKLWHTMLTNHAPGE